MEDVKHFFKEDDNAFTIFVVERKFVVGRGEEYFRSYIGKPNFIDSETIMKKRIGSILKAINKHIPDTAELIKSCFDVMSPSNIIDIIADLSKLFGVNEHQAASLDAIDPIIIQEGNILPKYISKIISLHKSSILRPIIIIMLKDNDFERAKKLLSGCPHNTNIKMIRNSGETEIYKVINCGADNPDDFLDAFADQCFSTCSNTQRGVLYNDEWAENSLLRQYGPTILRLRTCLLFRDKTLVRDELNDTITSIGTAIKENPIEAKILLSFECMLKLFRVFCNDGGTKDINDALHIAKELNNDILLAHVYKNAYFLEQFSLEEKMQLMDDASKIFSNNGMEDHAIYCKNNKLVRQFDTNQVSIYDFLTLQEEAIHNVPGLVGMSLILNNVGATLLTNGYPDEAINYFDKGLSYAYRPERSLQRISLLSNKIIAQSYCFQHVDENEIRKVLNFIFANNEVIKLPFLTSRYVLNILAVAFKQNKDLGRELLSTYPIIPLIQSSFDNHILGSGQILLQLNILEQKYNELDIANKLYAPSNILSAKGVRKEFIEKTGFNPCSFSTWF